MSLSKEEKAAYDREYYLQNKERKKQRMMERIDSEKANRKARYRKNCKKILDKKMADRAQETAKLRAWRQSNPEKWKAIMDRRRQRIANATVNDLTNEGWEKIKESQRGVCYYCGETPAELHKDHLIPIALGGDNTASNVVGACMKCNCSKGSKTEEEFRAFQAVRGQLCSTVG